jgi:hypothetical protein
MYHGRASSDLCLCAGHPIVCDKSLDSMDSMRGGLDELGGYQVGGRSAKHTLMKSSIVKLWSAAPGAPSTTKSSLAGKMSAHKARPKANTVMPWARGWPGVDR